MCRGTFDLICMFVRQQYSFCFLTSFTNYLKLGFSNELYKDNKVRFLKLTLWN